MSGQPKQDSWKRTIIAGLALFAFGIIVYLIVVGPVWLCASPQID